MRILINNLLIFGALFILGGAMGLFSEWFPLVPFFTFLTIVSFGSGISVWVLTKIGKKRPALFLSRLMTTLFVRMLAYLALIVLIVLNNKPAALVIAAQFAFIYLCFTIHEVIFLMKEAKKM